jgi:hypothetical protein
LPRSASRASSSCGSITRETVTLFLTGIDGNYTTFSPTLSICMYGLLDASNDEHCPCWCPDHLGPQGGRSLNAAMAQRDRTVPRLSSRQSQPIPDEAALSAASQQRRRRRERRQKLVESDQACFRLLLIKPPLRTQA